MIRYVLPVLRMTSFSHNGPVTRVCIHLRTVQPFLHSTAHPCAKHTDTHTTLHYVGKGRIYLLRVGDAAKKLIH